jgi:hypothetical protein
MAGMSKAETDYVIDAVTAFWKRISDEKIKQILIVGAVKPSSFL